MNLIKKIVTSNVTALSFAIGSAVIPIINKSTNQYFIYEYFIYGYAILFILYLITLITFFITDLVSRRRLLKNNQFPAIYISVEHDWSLSEQGDFYARSVYTAQNIGNDPISVLPFDDLVWFDEFEQVDFKIRIHESEKTYKIVEHRYNSYSYLLSLVSGLKKEKTNVISWSNIIDPPLKAGKSIKYVLEIYTPKTELKAFTKEGTYAGIPANLPTQYAKLNYVAPKGYHFELIAPLLVVDANRTVYPDDANGVNHPHLTATKSILQWELKNLKTGRRYWFKYRLEKDE